MTQTTTFYIALGVVALTLLSISIAVVVDRIKQSKKLRLS